ncbi:hypothetical protein PR202_ga15156 [Eleusine coracana subsp. coracana]|uniref:Uncharacterized protein n=1 Tax=Eleusine coracana subsp. coracana TaxID=191504 RepID=A0AAV5CI95_ELECO|nr:hypothetical protein QOZ80_6BG0496140 [Eleusine coracana subsp. coracana]GJM98171.1 hypothetical protein PR202_ga15156 [Eleusine coracana subsp. coracana]
MAPKPAAVVALLLLVVVGGGLRHHAHAAVPLRRALSVGWMNGMRGGSPGGMQPSETTSKVLATVGDEGNHHISAEDAKFIHTVPALVMPPRLPPS